LDDDQDTLDMPDLTLGPSGSAFRVGKLHDRRWHPAMMNHKQY
jgi:hypothetical protein